MKEAASSKTKDRVWVVENSKIHSRSDYLATEEPLEIRLVDPKQTVAITMRTPGADFELVAGFLYSEGIVRQRKDIKKIGYCVDPDIDGEQRYNIVNVALRAGLEPDLVSLERACGVCGKASIESLKVRGCAVSVTHKAIAPEIIYSLPDKLRRAQGIFTATGGLHAAALFNFDGELIKLREDVGRHNALDKLIGSTFLANELPLQECIVMVSGRSSFEILQKCVAAGVSIVCAVSAPSSLAVSVAKEFGITLIGFLRGQRFNIYSGSERVKV
jgi:FdhD protein